MKKLFCLLVLVLCSCRSVPSEYYVIELDKSEMVNLSYEFQEREEKGNWSGKWGSSVAEKMNAVIDVLEADARVKVYKNGTNIGKVIISSKVYNDGGSSIFKVPYALTLGIISLVGVPLELVDIRVDMNAKVYDNKGNFIREYNVEESNLEAVACYYGYSVDEAYITSYAGAYKKALEGIIKNINGDFKELSIEIGKCKRNEKKGITYDEMIEALE